MADKLTVSVTLGGNAPKGETESRTTRLLEHAVHLATQLHGTGVREITISAHDGTATVKFESLDTPTAST